MYYSLNINLFIFSRRRGNWITLKLKKLMKSSSRDQDPEQAATPPPSDIAQSHNFCPDSGSCISSDGSGGSSSTSAGDTISPQHTDCEYDLYLNYRPGQRQGTELVQCREREFFLIIKRNRYMVKRNATVRCVFKPECGFWELFMCNMCILLLLYIFPVFFLNSLCSLTFFLPSHVMSFLPCPSRQCILPLSLSLHLHPSIFFHLTYDWQPDTVKKFQHTRNKLKHRDKVKSLFRRSMCKKVLVHRPTSSLFSFHRWLSKKLPCPTSSATH